LKLIGLFPATPLLALNLGKTLGLRYGAMRGWIHDFTGIDHLPDQLEDRLNVEHRTPKVELEASIHGLDGPVVF